MKNNKFLTIRETARTGIMSEYNLRLMEKRGELPCVYVGESQRKCMINYNMLVEQLENTCALNARK